MQIPKGDSGHRVSFKVVDVETDIKTTVRAQVVNELAERSVVAYIAAEMVTSSKDLSDH